MCVSAQVWLTIGGNDFMGPGCNITQTDLQAKITGVLEARERTRMRAHPFARPHARTHINKQSINATKPGIPIVMLGYCIPYGPMCQ